METKAVFINREMPEDEALCRLMALIEKEKTEKGLIGFHASIGLQSGIKVADVAKEIVEMHEDYLAGRFEDITDKEL